MSGQSGPVSKTTIRDTLFGDQPIAFWAGVANDDEPWNLFKAAKLHIENDDAAQAISILRGITETPGLESRHYLEAFQFLRDLGVIVPSEKQKQVLGVVIEVGTQNDLDLVAAYTDHHARYYNYSGAGFVWERPTPLLDPQIDALIGAAQAVANAIGPWNGSRPPAPDKGQARINLLTPSGLHFGQGPMDSLSKDRLGGPVLSAAFRLMQSLIALTKKK